MKTIITTIGVLAIGGLLPLSAQVKQTEKTTDVTKNPDGSTTTTETKTTTFTPESRTKVVRYFDTYKGNPHGLPPAWVGKMKIKEIPRNWKSSRIEPGMMLQEKERSYLVEAPQDLVEVLPSPPAGVRYYLAGSNVIAVDTNYKVVDSIQIPSINIRDED
jgi:hypothetical protein